MRDEILAYKRDRILQEAVALFYERGFTGTTLDDIAHELGVTKPFIYSHFKSKTELLAAICVPTIEMSVAAAETGVNSKGSATERLHLLINNFTRVILERQPNIAIFFREEKALEPAVLEHINTLRRRFDRLLSGLLREGVSSGEFDISDVDLAALALGGMISWAYTWHRPTGRLNVDQLSNRMADLALRMAGARRDRPSPGLNQGDRFATGSRSTD
jgi:TetR/AcrR family transcriptional regulator, cholesterol catabolism regulator